ncbi:MAG: uridine kinase [Clostridia bacterium]|nr:uridine kinase [Clostridia bacterium]MBQ9856546.1 uridine kinase [Clostridia bacterium]
MLIIGICGASGSGKSTLAEELVKKITKPAVLINQDAYYRDHAYLPFEERAKINYDEPGVFEHDELLYDMKQLSEGKSITRKQYDYANHRRADQTNELIHPADIVIIEGIHAFYDERLRDMMDFKIYIRVDPDICLLRRVKRDINHRGREINGIAEQYLSTVKPMYERYIKTYIEYADLIVAGGGKNAKISDILAFYINAGQVEDK